MTCVNCKTGNVGTSATFCFSEIYVHFGIEIGTIRYHTVATLDNKYLWMDEKMKLTKNWPTNCTLSNCDEQWIIIIVCNFV